MGGGFRQTRARVVFDLLQTLLRPAGPLRIGILGRSAQQRQGQRAGR